jgi:hypothetical protein
MLQSTANGNGEAVNTLKAAKAAQSLDSANARSRDDIMLMTDEDLQIYLLAREVHQDLSNEMSVSVGQAKCEAEIRGFKRKMSLGNFTGAVHSFKNAAKAFR